MVVVEGQSVGNRNHLPSTLMEQFNGVSALVVDGFCFEKVENSMRSLRDGFNCCYKVIVFVGNF